MKTIVWFDFFVDADLFVNEEETLPVWMGGSVLIKEICSQLGMNEPTSTEDLEVLGETVLDKVKEQIEWESYPWVEIKINQNRMRFVLGPGIVHEQDWVIISNVFLQIMKIFNIQLHIHHENECLDVFLKKQGKA